MVGIAKKGKRRGGKIKFGKAKKHFSAVGKGLDVREQISEVAKELDIRKQTMKTCYATALTRKWRGNNTKTMCYLGASPPKVSMKTDLSLG